MIRAALLTLLLIAAELKAAFETDLKSCTEIDAPAWKKEQTPWHRAFDKLCYLMSGQL